MAIAIVFAVAPLVTACELAFDFDRTPLQPVYDGGPPPSDAGSSSDARDAGAG
jgi:hypothetical protein